MAKLAVRVHILTCSMNEGFRDVTTGICGRKTRKEGKGRLGAVKKNDARRVALPLVRLNSSAITNETMSFCVSVFLSSFLSDAQALVLRVKEN